MDDFFDASMLKELAQGPDVDTRTWICFGTVANDQELADPKAKSVLFPGDEQDLPFPIVMITLHPHGVSAPCPVAARIAGNGEAEWVPFVSGDEVVVGIAQGSERAGCVILGRLNQRLDKFPASVAAQGTDQNNLAFTRSRAPVLIESAAGVLLRSAASGAVIGISANGSATIANGDGGSLHVGPDYIGIGTNDQAACVQVLPESGLAGAQVHIEANGTILNFDGDVSTILTTGTLSIGTAGVSPSGHALTLEQLVGILTHLSTVVGLITPVAVAAALAAAATSALDPVSITAITAALQVAPDPSSNKFGVGCGGLMIG
ncbi:MAG: hypothetical protein PVSMB8_02780 [Vulcanimicrobiaceae bacterium]